MRGRKGAQDALVGFTDVAALVVAAAEGKGQIMNSMDATKRLPVVVEAAVTATDAAAEAAAEAAAVEAAAAMTSTVDVAALNKRVKRRERVCNRTWSLMCWTRLYSQLLWKQLKWLKWRPR